MLKINGHPSVFQSPVQPSDAPRVSPDHSDWIAASNAIASELPTPAVPNVAVEVLTEMINMEYRWLHQNEILFCVHQSNPKLGINADILEEALNQLQLQGDVQHSDASGRPHWSLAVLKLPGRTLSAWEIEYGEYLDSIAPDPDEPLADLPTELDLHGRA